MAAIGQPTTTYNSSTLPDFINQFASQGAGVLSGMMGAYNNIPQYNQPMVAGLTGQQQSLINGAQNASPEAPYMGASLNYLSQYNPTYDASQLGQYMDPYTQSAVGALTQISNRNLLNNILPGVNSTFTGNGMFGSNRNGIFNNRALYDNTLANNQTAAGMLDKQFNNAQSQYYQWNQNPLSASNSAAQTGATAGTSFWNGLANKFNLASQQQTINQNAMDKNYSNWKDQLTLPSTLIGNTVSSFNNLTNRYQPSTTAYNATSQAPQSNSQTAMGILALLAPYLS